TRWVRLRRNTLAPQRTAPVHLFKTWPVSADSGVTTTPSTRESAASHSSRGYRLDFRESHRANPGVHGGRRGAQRGSRILPHVHARARRTIGREAASVCCNHSRHRHAQARARWVWPITALSPL